MKIGTIVGFAVGSTLSFMIATKIKGDMKDKGKQMLKEKIIKILD